MIVNLQTRRGSGQRENGYILLTLVLMMALMAIFAATLVTSVTFDIKREREAEMIHRGTQYSRAVRAYYRKLSRYPTRIEDLESTSNLRFLRKRYKDPITGQDFKLLHFGEVQLALSGGMGGGIQGASSVGAGNGGLNGGMSAPGGFGQSSSFGGNSGLSSNSGFGTNTTSSFGQNQTNNQLPASDPSQSSSQLGQPAGDQTGTGAGPGNGTGTGGSGDTLAGLGGGPIVGVASASKKDSIREYNHKHKYNEWQFIYDPATDRGGLITTPNQPSLAAFGQQQPGQPGTPINGMNGAQPGGGGFVGNGQPPTGMLNDPRLNGPPTAAPNPPAPPQ